MTNHRVTCTYLRRDGTHGHISEWHTSEASALQGVLAHSFRPGWASTALSPQPAPPARPGEPQLTFAFAEAQP